MSWLNRSAIFYANGWLRAWHIVINVRWHTWEDNLIRRSQSVRSENSISISLSSRRNGKHVDVSEHWLKYSHLTKVDMHDSIRIRRWTNKKPMANQIYQNRNENEVHVTISIRQCHHHPSDSKWKFVSKTNIISSQSNWLLFDLVIRQRDDQNLPLTISHQSDTKKLSVLVVVQAQQDYDYWWYQWCYMTSEGEKNNVESMPSHSHV